MHEADAEIISRIHAWILKGTNQSFDALASAEKASDYSFTLLAATYREQTGLLLDDKDFLSFGLVNHNGLLTNAGCLMADQDIVYNSRLFCTRWNGLESEKKHMSEPYIRPTLVKILLAGKRS